METSVGSSRQQEHHYNSQLPSDTTIDKTNLPRPILPWLPSTDNVNRRPAASTSSRNSLGSTATGSVHLMKRYVPHHNPERKMRWSTFKWWILLSNTLVSNEYFLSAKEEPLKNISIVASFLDHNKKLIISRTVILLRIRNFTPGDSHFWQM